jgi:tetratricopeptide (TPR) repeat protein
MSDHQHQEKKVSVSRQLVRIIQRYRIVFIVLAVAAIVFPIVYFVVDSTRQKTMMEGAKKIAELDEKQKTYDDEKDKDKKIVAEKELLDAIDKTAGQFGGDYAGSYSLLMRVRINYQKLVAVETIDKKVPALAVITDLSRIINQAGDNILTPLALNHLATILRNLGTLVPDSAGGKGVSLDELVKILPGKVLGSAKPAKTDEAALLVFQYLVEHYPKSLNAAEALMNIGFLMEAKGDTKAALEAYGRLESGYGNNLWTKMAVNRKLALEAGKVGTP